MIGSVCLLVGSFGDSFVGLFVRHTRCDFSKSKIPIIMKFGTDVQRMCQISLLTFQSQDQSSRSKPPY